MCIYDRTTAAIVFQKCLRGNLYRKKRLPIFLYVIRDFLIKQAIVCNQTHEDGRINSSLDEPEITQLLKAEFGDRIKIYNKRFWCDIKIRDYKYGWLPVNIKVTTAAHADNTCSFAMCLQAYTDMSMSDIESLPNRKSVMLALLVEKLKHKQYNVTPGKDYFFLIINKNDTSDIIVNSVGGLNVLSPNASNPPFQVRWDKNREFTSYTINQKIAKLLPCIKLIDDKGYEIHKTAHSLFEEPIVAPPFRKPSKLEDLQREYKNAQNTLSETAKIELGAHLEEFLDFISEISKR